MLRAKRQGALVALAAAIAGCQELAAIDAGECGNLIIDPDEDCDGSVPTDVTVPKDVTVQCGATGSPRACRFDCSPPEDPADKRKIGCPETYFCGADRVCRAPAGQFDPLSALPASPSHVLLGDFDGDGLSDLLSLDDDSGGIEVAFFERDGAVARTFSIPSDGAVPAIGNLVPDPTDGKPTRDFTLSVEGGLGVMQGQEDRNFVATAYASVSPPWDDPTLRLFTLHLFADPMSGLSVRDSIVALHKDKSLGWGLYPLDPTVPTLPTERIHVPMPFASATAWAKRLPVGNFVEDPVNSPCDDIALVPDGGPAILVVSPCLGPMPGSWNTNPTSTTAVQLPGGDTVVSAIAAHINPVHGSQPFAGRDNHLDLMIEGKKGIYVAYGRGDGSFQSAPDNASPPPVPGQATKVDKLANAMPLAIADINDDGAPDAVMSIGVLLSKSGSVALDPTQYYLAAAPLGPSGWDDAVIVDFNGDGALDVVASSKGDTGVALFTNAHNGTFNPDIVATEQHVGSFVIGDFDGDLQSDIAFREGGDGGPAGVWVMFGQKGGPPLTPRSLGVLPAVDQIVAGVDFVPFGTSSSVSDIGVLTNTDKIPKIAGFLGRPDRLLQAPFRFLDSTPGSVSLGVQTEGTAIGRFHAGGEDHDDIAVIVSDQNLCDQNSLADIRADARLWLLLGTGTAGVSGASNSGSLCGAHKSVVWQSAVLAPLDVDGDGVDELIIAAPNKGKGSDDVGALFVARQGAAGFDLGEMIPLPERLYDRSIGLGPNGKALRRNAPLCVADVDGDGQRDVVMLTVDNTSDVEKSGVTILWGTGDANKPFSISAIGHVTLESDKTDEWINGFACTDADGDAAADLVVVTSRGAYLANGAKSREMKAKALHDSAGNALPGGVSVASGNVDDDHLQDIAISGPSGILVYRGKAIIK